jgi:hypothetical protein
VLKGKKAVEDDGTYTLDEVNEDDELKADQLS